MAMRKIHSALHHAVYRDVENDEYVVKLKSDPGYKPVWYFTSDKDDAIDTCNTMSATEQRRLDDKQRYGFRSA